MGSNTIGSTTTMGVTVYSTPTPGHQQVNDYRLGFAVVNRRTGQVVDTISAKTTTRDSSGHIDMGMLESYPELSYGGKELLAARAKAAQLARESGDGFDVRVEWTKITSDAWQTPPVAGDSVTNIELQAALKSLPPPPPFPGPRQWVYGRSLGSTPDGVRFIAYAVPVSGPTGVTSQMTLFYNISTRRLTPA